MTYEQLEEYFFKMVNEVGEDNQVCDELQRQKFKEVLPDLDVQPHIRMAYAIRTGCPCEACRECSNSLLVSTAKMYFAKKMQAKVAKR